MDLNRYKKISPKGERPGLGWSPGGMKKKSIY